MLRKLGTFEKAVLVSNQHAAFHINVVLGINNPPPPDEITSAIKILQARHPLLRARITRIGKDFFYVDSGDHSFPFQIMERKNDNYWIEIAEKEMASKIQIPQDALFRITYLVQPDLAELIFVFHHSITDAVSSSNLLDELLRVLAGDEVQTTALPVLPKVEDRAPKGFRGFKRITHLSRFGLKQITQEMLFQWKNLGKRKPPVRLGSYGRIMTFAIPEEKVNALAFIGRKNKLTLNSILNAAQLIAINRILYHGNPAFMYTFSFANLRPYTNPPADPNDMGSYISMLRIPINVSGDSDLWNLSQKIHQSLQKAFNAGDKFTAYFSSEIMLKMLTTSKIMRFGAAALNYSSGLNFKERYGSIDLLAVHGFVSGFDLGPEIGSQARFFRGQLVWDFTYLESDYNQETASQIADEIISIFDQAIS